MSGWRVEARRQKAVQVAPWARGALALALLAAPVAVPRAATIPALVSGRPTVAPTHGPWQTLERNQRSLTLLLLGSGLLALSLRAMKPE
jgi:hypothetical protein